MYGQLQAFLVEESGRMIPIKPKGRGTSDKVLETAQDIYAGLEAKGSKEEVLVLTPEGERYRHYHA
jgi:hypothetical protein